eukprot:CAMPEP_0177546398 /NCGR_PEP_ID=MMETSP0369-20130122/63199_1 /TAXON_ID=447022 ORGANISM="Scrippsiella hangoei-like, Strain SHHI-4" /NCGR_SAMPLE_ID=MMETSP0369 /ASSEMBLY_ACC=CAM_ASM_000364 /LENGTH=73 /DNA_ID=CAMNT_0019030893 /DNA_START=79 /DNA_END=297 /DNA_ORIENTATION=+
MDFMLGQSALQCVSKSFGRRTLTFLMPPLIFQVCFVFTVFTAPLSTSTASSVTFISLELLPMADCKHNERTQD